MDQDNTFSHISVLLHESIDALNIRNGFTYVDCTAGGGGHSLEIAKRMGPDSRLICFDRDPSAISAAQQRLSDYSDRVIFINDNFSSLKETAEKHGINNIAGVLADLGCSSYQFDTPERGFSYMHDAPLDMRMSPDSYPDAKTVINTYSEDKLKKILYEYGEERFAGKIASEIVKRRAVSPIETTRELTDIILSAIPKNTRNEGHHPAKRTFQAIRIEVNSELDVIEPTIRDAADIMVPGGRIAFISFHSLEDRIVKQTFASLASGCTCPKDFPVCMCNKKPKVKILTKKPILPSEEETENNPRARSAKLRVAEVL